MSKLFSKVVIEDVRNAGCIDKKVELLAYKKSTGGVYSKAVLFK